MILPKIIFKYNRMAKRGGTRKSGRGIFRRVYSPIYHLIEASRNVGKSIFKRSGRVVNESLGLVQNVGKSVASHANMTVKNITRRRSNRRGSRRNRK